MLLEGARVAAALVRAEEEPAVFVEILAGVFRIMGAGWCAEVPLRSWAPDQVFGVFKVLRGRDASARGGLGWSPEHMLDVSQQADGTLLLGTRRLTPMPEGGTFWWQKESS